MGANDDGLLFMTQPEGRQKQNYIERPSASIVLLTFNQEQFVQDALESLLNQDYEELEIVISDDCSKDGTWEQIQTTLEGYKGPKKVIAIRNQANLGIVDNYASAFKKTSGDLIFMAAGDDISLPNRCSLSIQFWRNCEKEYDLVAADAIDMSYTGEHLKIKEIERLEDWTTQRWFECKPFFFGASFMVTRRLLNLAPLNNQFPYEDQCLVFRSLLMGGAVRLPKPLVCYRRGGLTQSSGFKFGHRRSLIKKGIALEILELNQFLSDAAILNKQSQIEIDVARRLELCQAISNLFQEPKRPYNVKEFWQNTSIPIKLKYRYLRYYFFYPFLAVGHLIRDIIRIIKKR
jgi:glycosyltransferase involved in cell wall biosynthesis